MKYGIAVIIAVITLWMSIATMTETPTQDFEEGIVGTCGPLTGYTAYTYPTVDVPDNANVPAETRISIREAVEAWCPATGQSRQARLTLTLFIGSVLVLLIAQSHRRGRQEGAVGEADDRRSPDESPTNAEN